MESPGNENEGALKSNLQHEEEEEKEEINGGGSEMPIKELKNLDPNVRWFWHLCYTTYLVFDLFSIILELSLF